MRLCDRDIERYLDQGIIALDPRPDNEKINGATVDVSLGNSFRVFQEYSAPYIDLSGPREEVSAQLERVMSDEIVLNDDEAFFYIRACWHWRRRMNRLNYRQMSSVG